MKKPNYDVILKDKQDYYGKTLASFEFAAEEYARQLVNYQAHDDDCVINQMKCNCSKQKDYVLK